MDKKEFANLYTGIEEGEIAPSQFHKDINFTNAYELIPEVKKLLDEQFWEGFKAAYGLIDNIFCGYQEPPFDDLWEEIEEEFDLYKKDG